MKIDEFLKVIIKCAHTGSICPDIVSEDLLQLQGQFYGILIC